MQHKIDEQLNKIGEKYYQVHKGLSKIDKYEQEIALLRRLLESAEPSEAGAQLSVLDLVEDFATVERPFKVQHYQQM